MAALPGPPSINGGPGRDATHLRRHIISRFGDRAIGSIRPSEIQVWVKDRSAILAPATMTVVYRYLSAIFRMAVRDGLIAKSPCVDVQLPVPHVDFLRRTLHVEQQLVLLPKQPAFLAPPKTESSDRRIPVGDFVLHALSRHMQEYPTQRILRAVTRRDEPLIFTNTVDGPVSRTKFSAVVWRPAIRRSGLPEGSLSTISGISTPRS